MPDDHQYFCISVRWLDERYHGRTDEGESREWPPSPLRLFQALLAGAARAGRLPEAQVPLRWLESLAAPTILAPVGRAGCTYTTFVPNNDADKLLDRHQRLTAKKVRPTLLPPETVVHYVWPLAPADLQLVDAAARVTSDLTALGWGIDLAYAQGQLISSLIVEELAKNSDRWSVLPSRSGRTRSLRVACSGTLDELLAVHKQRIGRLAGGILNPSDLMFGCFRTLHYARPGAGPNRPFALFRLARPDGSPFAFPQERLIELAAMARHEAINCARRSAPPQVAPNAAEWADRYIAGHRSPQAHYHRQISYLPLPSIGHQHVDGRIRRILLVDAPDAAYPSTPWLAEELDGAHLQSESDQQGPVLERLNASDSVQRYLCSSRSWTSVTPVILPGFDDRKREKRLRLLMAALEQVGLTRNIKRIEWSAAPSWPGSLIASTPRLHRDYRRQYRRPAHLQNYPCCHVRLEFNEDVPGPIAIGAGRHRGLGVLAAPH